MKHLPPHILAAMALRPRRGYDDGGMPLVDDYGRTTDLPSPPVPVAPKWSPSSTWVDGDPIPSAPPAPTKGGMSYMDAAKTVAGNMLGGVKDAATLPGDVYAGRVDPMSDQGIARANNLAMMLPAAGMPMAEEGAVGSAGGKLFDYSRLDEVPKVPQFDLPRYEPPRGVSGRVADLVANKYVRDHVMSTIQDGMDMGGGRWYNNDPLLDHFKTVLGKDDGTQAFNKYMDFVGATSPRSDVGTNVRNASYYYQKQMSGEPMPEVGAKNDQPYGHMAQRLHQMNAQTVAGDRWDPFQNPKPASFVQNLTGNQLPGTIDTHAFRLPAILSGDDRFLVTDYQTAKDAPKQNIQAMVRSGEIPMEVAQKTAAYWDAMPKKNEYAAMERYYQDIAKEMSHSTAQTQAGAWVGGGETTGLASDSSKPFLQFLEDRVRLTAKHENMDPSDVLDQFIRGERRLRSTGGRV